MQGDRRRRQALRPCELYLHDPGRRPLMRYPAQHKAETRSRILAAAGRLLRTKGLAGVSVEQAMAGAGLTVGGFYAHFRTRNALLGEALGRALDEAWRRALDGMAELSGSAFVHALLRFYGCGAH